MSAPELPRRDVIRRLRVCVSTGSIIGVAYSAVALVLDAFPTARARRLGWEPSTLDALFPVVGGVLLGMLVALLWPARRHKLTAVAAGIVAAAPFAASIAVSLGGSANLNVVDIGVAGLVCVVLGVPIGAFMYDYDR